MFVNILSIAATLAVAVAAATPEAGTVESYTHFGPEVHPDDVSCDPAGQIFLLLPDYYDCNKFHMCVHGEEVMFYCSAPSLIFDFHKQECNWAWAGNCTLRTPPEDIEGSGDEVNDNMIGFFNDVIEQDAVDLAASVRPISPMLAKYGGVLNCNRADEAARQVAYKGDCQRYWRCVGGVAQVAYCSDGLFFNEATQQCDFEANSKCNAVLPEDELQSEFIVYNN